MIGQKFVLWRSEYRRDAYRDQLGIAHGGYVVLEQIPVKVIEVREDVPGMFGGSLNKGIKATSETGEKFFRHWNVYPDDSMTPNYFWDARKDDRGLWRPEDACQAYNHHIPHVTPLGKKVVPIGATICKEHDYAYMEDHRMGCFECYCDKSLAMEKGGGSK